MLTIGKENGVSASRDKMTFVWQANSLETNAVSVEPARRFASVRRARFAGRPFLPNIVQKSVSIQLQLLFKLYSSESCTNRCISKCPRDCFKVINCTFQRGVLWIGSWCTIYTFLCKYYFLKTSKFVCEIESSDGGIP